MSEHRLSKRLAQSHFKLVVKMRHTFGELRILFHQNLSRHYARQTRIGIGKVEHYRYHHLHAPNLRERIIVTDLRKEIEQTRLDKANQRIKHGAFRREAAVKRGFRKLELLGNQRRRNAITLGILEQLCKRLQNVFAAAADSSSGTRHAQSDWVFANLLHGSDLSGFKNGHLLIYEILEG